MLIPTKDSVDEAIRLFDEENLLSEEALGKLFGMFPKNSDEREVLLKVVCLNRLYSTQILAVTDMAHHIYSNHELIDEGLASDSAAIVDLIAKIEIQGKIRNCFSFATKYCSWHKPDLYPVYDSRVDWYLWHLQKQHPFSDTFEKNNYTSYQDFRQIVSDFRKHFELDQFTYKQIDKFFWLHGNRDEVASLEQ